MQNISDIQYLNNVLTKILNKFDTFNKSNYNHSSMAHQKEFFPKKEHFSNLQQNKNPKKGKN